MLNKIFVINCVFTTFFFIHIAFIAYNLKYPRNPSIRVYRKNIEDIEFPISVKLCVKTFEEESKIFQKFGYSHDYGFFTGFSMYNLSLKGWNGHTKTGSTLGPVDGKTIFFHLPHLNLEILQNVSTNWSTILRQIALWSISPLIKGRPKNPVRINGSDILWSKTPLFPSCQLIDVSPYWKLKKTPITLLFITFFLLPLSLSLGIDDRQRALTKRSLRSASVAYESPLIELNDILPPRIQKYFLTMSQTIELESSGECKNYPTSGYLNYRECDEDFVYNEMKNKYKFMPFWAAKTLSEVTKLT